MWSDFLAWLIDIRPILGALTVLTSVIGAALVLSHAHFFSRSHSKLARILVAVYISDALIYVVTALFGLGAYLDFSLETRNLLQTIRVVFLLPFNIIAGVYLAYYIRNEA